MNELPDDTLKKAQDFLMDGRVEQARPLLVDFIRWNPGSAEGWFLLSFVIPEQARQVECLERALKIDPGLSRASLRLSQLTSSANSPAPEDISPPETPPAPEQTTSEMPKVSPFVDTDFNFPDENTSQVGQPAPRSWFEDLQSPPAPAQVEPQIASAPTPAADAGESDRELEAAPAPAPHVDLPEAEELVNLDLPQAQPGPSGLTRNQKIWIWVWVIIFALILISFGILYIGTQSVLPTPPPTGTPFPTFTVTPPAP